MPIIPPIRPGQTLTKQAPRKRRANANERVASDLQQATHGRERRFKQERRLKRIKMSFDRRHRGNRRLQNNAAEDAAETQNNIGQHINTKA